MTSDSPPPVVCTLTTKALAERALEWSDLATLALSALEIEDGVVSTYPLADADRIEALAAAEVNCCGTWLDIATARGEVFTLTLTTTNPEGLDLIRAMSGLSTE